ncbi:type II toxin-antitoxin system HigB family toxin [Xylanibacter rarus]
MSNSIDYVYKQHYVFNIKGNNLRPIVAIIFTKNLFIITLLALMQNMIK